MTTGLLTKYTDGLNKRSADDHDFLTDLLSSFGCWSDVRKQLHLLVTVQLNITALVVKEAQHQYKNTVKVLHPDVTLVSVLNVFASKYT